MLVVGFLTCAGTLVVGPPAARARSGCANARLRPDGRNAAAIDAATLCLIDQVRGGYGLRALHPNRQLRTVAASQVGSMLRWNYFADVRPSGQTPFSLVLVSSYRAHAASISVGQNIAWASGTYATPEHVVADWMASPPHRQIMLSGAFRDAGVAVSSALPSVLHAGHRGALYAVEFGARR